VRLGQFRLGVCFWCDWRDLRSFGLTFFALEARSESLSVGLLGFGMWTSGGGERLKLSLPKQVAEAGSAMRRRSLNEC
jgi:hypothetical protein